MLGFQKQFAESFGISQKVLHWVDMYYSDKRPSVTVSDVENKKIYTNVWSATGFSS